MRIAVARTVVATASIAALALAGAVAVPIAASAATSGDIKITEWEYNGSEFVEFTNLDSVPVDLTGWSFSDSDEHAGDVPFDSLGTVLPGESFLLSEVSAVDFRAEWGLPDTVKVLGDNGHNLGRSDEVNLYDPDGTLVDRLTYNDQGTGSVAGPRTDTASAWPNSADVLGANTADAWTRSTAGDADASWTSADGQYVGSPGISRFGTGVRWVRINEVDSDTDSVELVNLAPVAVDVSGWTQTDSGHAPGALTGLSSPTVPAHGYVTFTSNQGLSSDGDAVRLYLADGTTLLDSATYGANQAEPGSWSRCPDGTGADFVHAATATFGAANDCSGDPGDGGDGGTPPTDPANYKDIVVNEVSSDNDSLGFAPLPTLSDGIELYNTGTESVDLTGWKQIDSGAADAATDFSGRLYVDGALSTVIPAGHYGVFSSGKGLSSGGDAVKIYTAAGTPVDSLTYLAGQAGVDETVNTDHLYQSLARCVVGDTDTFLEVKTASFGASNTTACATGVPPLTGGSGPEAPCDTENSGTDPGTVPTTALTWPGGDTPVTIDAECDWVTSESGQDLSGLAFDPNDANVLYAVKNKSHVWRLVNSGGAWVKDTANGWTDGKDLRFPGGTGKPDTEGLAVGPDGSLYITTERDNDASGVPLDTILRFDPTTSDTTLAATDEWNLTSDLGFSAADANLGFEGVAYVPDSFLVAQGFRTDDGALYDPSAYPDKVAPGLFFGAVEKTGHLLAYALNADTDHTWTRVADVSSGMAGVMDESFDPDLGRIWAHCDNTCGNATALLKIGADGHFTVDKYYARPANLPNYNLEGFAVAPASTAVDGQRQVLWSDDGNRFGHSLWAGTIRADLPLSVVVTPSTATPAPGDTITITADGLTPGTEYEAVLHSTPVLLGKAVAGPSGTLNMSVTIPANTPAGVHTITIAASSDPNTILASIGITVVAALASTGVSPEPGLIGAAVLLLLGVGMLVVRRLRRRPAGAAG